MDNSERIVVRVCVKRTVINMEHVMTKYVDAPNSGRGEHAASADVRIHVATGESV